MEQEAPGGYGSEFCSEDVPEVPRTRRELEAKWGGGGRVGRASDCDGGLSLHEMVVLSGGQLDIAPAAPSFVCEVLTQSFFKGAGKIGYALATRAIERILRCSVPYQKYTPLRPHVSARPGWAGEALVLWDQEAVKLLQKVRFFSLPPTHPSLTDALATVSVPLSYSLWIGFTVGA